MTDPSTFLGHSVFLLNWFKGSASKCDIQDQGSTLQVIHVNSPCSPFRPKTPLSWQDNVLHIQTKDKARLQYLSILVGGKSIVPIASGRTIIQNSTYIVRAKIGTPPQTLLLAVDTSNDAAWVPCTGCIGSHQWITKIGAQQPAQEDQAPVCKQGPNMHNCLKIQEDHLYYVNLMAIKVGNKVVAIPATVFAFDPNTGAGTIIDSGTIFTNLVKAAHTRIREEFRGGWAKPTYGFETCYPMPIKIPSITFIFSGMNVTLTQENFIKCGV